MPFLKVGDKAKCRTCGEEIHVVSEPKLTGAAVWRHHVGPPGKFTDHSAIPEKGSKVESKPEATVEPYYHKWEYKLAYPSGTSKDEDVFNGLGDEGWELVCIDNDSAYFKRPKG